MQKAAIVILVLAVGVGGALLFLKRHEDDASIADAHAVQQEGAESSLSAPTSVAPERQGVPLPDVGSREGASDGVRSDSGTTESPAVAETDGEDKPRDPAASLGHSMRLPPIPPPSFSNTVRPPLPTLSEFSDRNPRSPAPSLYSSQPPASLTVEASSPTAPPAANPVDDKQEEPASREHVIVNGDTLERIARRYLGDSSRAGELLDWNRDVLKDPSVLPLGCSITIPPKQSVPRRLPQVTHGPAREVGGNPTYDLVPLPRGAISRDG